MARRVLIRNKRHYHGSGRYVGRPTVLGNPFTIGRDGDRADVVDKYSVWLRGEIAKHREVDKALDQLAQELRAKGQLTLICWCAPLACHAEVIRDEIIRRAK